MKESTMQSEPVSSLKNLLPKTLSSMETSPTPPVTATIFKLDAKTLI